MLLIINSLENNTHMLIQISNCMFITLMYYFKRRILFLLYLAFQIEDPYTQIRPDGALISALIMMYKEYMSVVPRQKYASIFFNFSL